MPACTKSRGLHLFVFDPSLAYESEACGHTKCFGLKAAAACAQTLAVCSVRLTESENKARQPGDPMLKLPNAASNGCMAMTVSLTMSCTSSNVSMQHADGVTACAGTADRASPHVAQRLTRCANAQRLVVRSLTASAHALDAAWRSAAVFHWQSHPVRARLQACRQLCSVLLRFCERHVPRHKRDMEVKRRSTETSMPPLHQTPQEDAGFGCIFRHQPHGKLLDLAWITMCCHRA